MDFWSYQFTGHQKLSRDSKECSNSSKFNYLKELELGIEYYGTHVTFFNLDITIDDVYKSLIRPHFDYEDIKYAQTYNASFYQKLESLQYNSTLTTRGTSTEKIYRELHSCRRYLEANMKYRVK